MPRCKCGDQRIGPHLSPSIYKASWPVYSHGFPVLFITSHHVSAGIVDSRYYTLFYVHSRESNLSPCKHSTHWAIYPAPASWFTRLSQGPGIVIWLITICWCSFTLRTLDHSNLRQCQCNLSPSGAVVEKQKEPLANSLINESEALTGALGKFSDPAQFTALLLPLLLLHIQSLFSEHLHAKQPMFVMICICHSVSLQIFNHWSIVGALECPKAFCASATQISFFFEDEAVRILK